MKYLRLLINNLTMFKGYPHLLSILLMGLCVSWLSACTDNESGAEGDISATQTSIDVQGIWQDSFTVLKACPQDPPELLDIQLSIIQPKGRTGVAGELQMAQALNTGKPKERASFIGTLMADGHLHADITLLQDEQNHSYVFDGMVSGETIQGTLEGPPSSKRHADNTCEETLKGKLSLIRTSASIMFDAPDIIEAPPEESSDMTLPILPIETPIEIIPNPRSALVKDTLKTPKTLTPQHTTRQESFVLGQVDAYQMVVPEPMLMRLGAELFAPFDTAFTLVSSETPVRVLEQGRISSTSSSRVSHIGMNTILDEGTYLLIISSEPQHGTADFDWVGSYELRLDMSKALDRDFEPNDHRRSASLITLPLNATFMTRPGDEDWVSFALKETTTIRLDTGTNAQEGGLHYALYTQGLEEPLEEAAYTGQPVVFTLDEARYSLRLYSEQDITFPVTIESTQYATSHNTTKTKATRVPLPFSAHMSLEPNESDWFMVSLTAPQVLHLDLGESYYGLEYRVYREGDESPVVERPYTGESTQQVLSAGTHYIEVHAYEDLQYSDTPVQHYPLMISSSLLPDELLEPNDTRAEAAPLTFDGTQTSTSLIYLTANDHDWLRFTLSEDTLLTLTVGRSDTLGYEAQLKDENGQGVSGIFITTEGTPNQHLLPPGTYYLHLSSYQFEGETAITLQGEPPPDAGLEPNNTSTNPTRIAPGLTLEGLLVTPLDEDWYTFSLPKAAQIQVELVSEQYPALELRTSDNVLITSGYPLSEALHAGRYLLRVSSYTTLLYDLQVISTP